MRKRCVVMIAMALVLAVAAHSQHAPVHGAEPAWLDDARAEFPKTDFDQHAIDLSRVRAGGPARDGIPAIDAPKTVPVKQLRQLRGREPVIGVVLNGAARAYPLSILIWHEIVNDTLGGVPIAVTYCPLCNTGLVFDRRIAGDVLDFGVTGRLFASNLLMYDRQTESWWQQFTGEAVIGAHVGQTLALLPARLESYDDFRERAPEGEVLVPASPRARSYGRNPYIGYDGSGAPFMYAGDLPADIAPLARVVRVDNQAWPLAAVRDAGERVHGDLRLQWHPGQASALDAPVIADGLDVGSVVVQERTDEGWRDVPYSVDFAFAFHAFYPNGTLHR